MNISWLTPTCSWGFRFVLQDYVVKEEGRRRHMSAVFSLCACIYGRHGTEWSNVANSVIQLREKCIVCLTRELHQIERWYYRLGPVLSLT